MERHEEDEELPGPLGYAAAAFVNALGFVLINAHPVWRPLTGGVVTERFSEVLWAINLGALVQVFGNLWLMSAATPLRRRVMELCFSALALLGAVVMYEVFPFDLVRFGPYVQLAGHVVLALGIFGAAVGTLVNFFKLLGGGAPPRPAHP